MACEFFNRYYRPCRGPRHGVVDSFTLLDHCGRVLRVCGLLLALAALSLAGCAAPQRIEAPPSTQPARDTNAIQQQGGANVAGKFFEYNSTLPFGQLVLMSFMLYLSHRREMARLNAVDSAQ